MQFAGNIDEVDFTCAALASSARHRYERPLSIQNSSANSITTRRSRAVGGRCQRSTEIEDDSYAAPNQLLTVDYRPESCR